MSAAVIVRHCPECGSRLSIRTNRTKGNRFIGCTAYPHCKFTEDYDPAVQELITRLQALEQEVRVLRSSARWSAPQVQPDLAGIEKAIKELIFKFHPDRNPTGLVANEVVSTLNDLRSKVRR